MTLPDGIPTIADYRRLLTSPLFRRMREYADRFLAANREALAPYSRKWVGDPLHNWSRQWEYPYTFAALSDEVGGGAGPGARRILDAGSGVTFFPHYLSSMLDRCEVVCLDLDATLERVFRAVVSDRKDSVRFSRADLHRIPEPDDTFDAVYCISVLEHTADYLDALLEFRRVLRPGGRLVVTFDICLDGEGEIPISAAIELLGRLHGLFSADRPAPGDDLVRGLREDIVTTRSVARQDRSLLPWGGPVALALRNLLTSGRPTTKFPNLTFYCARFVNDDSTRGARPDQLST